MGAYTTIDDPTEYFNVKLYAGQNNDNVAFTFDANAGDFQPDWLWIKNRTTTQHHALFDSSRGPTKRILTSLSSSNQETTENTNLDSFDSNGFTLDEETIVNKDSNNYVAWGWKANGGSLTTNDASSTGVGSLDSQYQANTTAGFSIVTWTGTGNAGTIAHGLGVAPKVMWVKNRDKNSQFAVYHKDIGATHYLAVSDDDARADYDQYWNDTHPTSTVFSVGADGDVHGANNEKVVGYMFAEIAGFSRFGSYLGNGNNSGPYIYTGFKPELLIIKIADGHDESWHMWDIKRSANGNPNREPLSPNTTAAEIGGDSTPYDIDFCANGFKIREDHDLSNGDGDRYIYMAWARNPFVTSTGVPVTAE